MDKYELGRRITKYRMEQGLSVTQLSNKTDIPRVTLHQIEYGTYSPSIHRLLVIAKVLKISPMALLCPSEDDGMKETVWEKFVKLSSIDQERTMQIMDIFAKYATKNTKGNVHTEDNQNE